MKRVPLGDLRAAFADPPRYARRFTGKSRSGGPSKYGMFLHAVGEFHRSGDLQKAQDYLRDKIENNFKNVGDLSDYSRKLQVYAGQFRRLGHSFVRVRDNVTIPLSSDFSDFVVSGQAARVDLVPAGGYAIWVFVRGDPDWREDPRMPLLQFSYCQKLGVDFDEVSVGIYDFEIGQHLSDHFTSVEVNNARRELGALLRLLKRAP